ncbi:hypothetical protein [Brachybacterium phenoliresistens]|uniref:Uncharacterized protein n=1 Tax=Brachybacterium phenoliresistens TaxID=396014 RepID=Z9JUP0_9MICO|nr:hypothetical protein [Brachybacterium phenoliresistens]EWS81924.1 hypothetical protein BF93_13930 [Brachybacterium phenoliresistens]
MTHPSDPASPQPGSTPAPAPDAAESPDHPVPADAPGEAPAADGPAVDAPEADAAEADAPAADAPEADGPRGAESAEEDGPAADAADAEDSSTPEGTVILVRRRRMPSLGFWVLGCMLLAALAGAVVAYVVEVRYLAGMVYFAVTGAVFFGLPLAALAALVDALRHRRTDRRR